MRSKKKKTLPERFAESAIVFTGSNAAFFIALGLILTWIITGPVFGYSDTWQLVINTSTTVITFLMVFLIQRAQNKDSHALHLKLNEIVASMEGASNRLIDVEDLSEAELETLKKFYIHLSAMAKKEKNISQSHSIEEAAGRHEHKYKREKG
jgi:low affinity Fe/Cu permease